MKINETGSFTRRMSADVWISLLIMGGGLVWLAHGIDRHQHVELLLALVLVFTCYGWLLFCIKNERMQRGSFGILLAVAVTFRIVLLFSLPSLSDDVYRFLWDGRLLDAGIDPYRWVPDDAIRRFDIPDEAELYQLLNHSDTYTTYPPFTQFFSWLAVVLGSGFQREIIVMRIPVLIADVCSVILLAGLLRDLGRPVLLAFAYALHPLVILELTGNLHHEVWVVFFVLLFLRLYFRYRYTYASLAIAGAASAKLLPLIFIPVVIFKTGSSRRYAMVFLILALTAVMTLPMWSAGWSNGLGLYFQRFEFNPSLWAIVREVAWWFTGYNIIGMAGPLMAAATLVLILTIAHKYRSQHIAPVMASCLTVYLLFATTVHPWYVIPLIPLGILSGFVFPIVWGGMVMLTYLGYTSTGYDPPCWVGFAEYGTLALAIAFDLKWLTTLRLWKKAA